MFACLVFLVLASFFVPVFVQCFLLLSNILEGNSFAFSLSKKYLCEGELDYVDVT